MLKTIEFYLHLPARHFENNKWKFKINLLSYHNIFIELLATLIIWNPLENIRNWYVNIENVLIGKVQFENVQHV